MPAKYDIEFGTRYVWGGDQPFGLNDVDAFQHIYLNGQTGTGKSTLLKNIYSQIIHNEHGCTLVDFNGDISDEVLALTPPEYRHRLVFIDVADKHNVVPINPFYRVPQDQRATFASQFVEAVKFMFRDSWGDRMDWILYNVVALILDAPSELRPTLLSIAVVLVNKQYRDQLVGAATDPDVIRFFKTQFDRYSDRDRDTFIMPIENKIGKILANPYIRNMLSPYEPSFQLSSAIADQSIVILRLPKGIVGTNPVRLLGSLSVSTLVNAAFAQQAISYEQRIPHFLIIDEKQNLETTSLISAYSESRKYKFGLITSSQYLGQLNDGLVSAIMGNVGTIIAFRSSLTDAKILEAQVGKFPAKQYTTLNLGEIRARLIRNGSPVEPFPGNTYDDQAPAYAAEKQLRALNRERYTLPADKIAETYGRWIRKMSVDIKVRKDKQRATSKRQEERKHKRLKKPVEKTPTEPQTVTHRRDSAMQGIRDILARSTPGQTTSPTRPLTRPPNRRRNRRAKRNLPV